MSNKDLLRRLIDEVWNGGKLDAVDEFIASDYVDHDPANPGVVGPEAVKQLVTKYRSALPDLSFSIIDQVEEGDRVVTRWESRGTHQGELEGIPPSGRSVRTEGITISRISDGKVAEDWVVWDALGFMQQIQ